MPPSLKRLTVATVDEQFRILGRERQADLDREAQRFALADLVQREHVARVHIRPWVFRQLRSVIHRRAVSGSIPAAPPSNKTA
jgi:hypothetical protein